LKALIISPRFPWPPYTGDRLRATIWLASLSPHAHVTLVAPSGNVPAHAPRFDFRPASRSWTRGLLGVMTAIRDRLPLQCLMAAPFDWASATKRAIEEQGPFDVTVVLLSRMHPWVPRPLQGRIVLDAVDSLRRSAEQRALEAAPLLRWLWRIEERRMARLESDLARLYDHVLVVSEDETAEFGSAEAVPNGVEILPEHEGSRAFDFGFWGRFPYFANRDAATWLLDEIWPAIRALRPSATLIVGGAEASESLRELARRRGVTMVSPIADVAAFARNIRVALMPVRFGTGQLGKVLEAAEAGCAIVGTPQALRGLAPLALHARMESTAGGIARAAIEVLDDPKPLGKHVRDAVVASYARSTTTDRLRAIAAGADA
jgi:polysaccharide biosynthesis protein PslH